jgi:hypothetical protein
VNASAPSTSSFPEHRVSLRVLLATAAMLCLFYALLWSPWWYPLSDSALYLNMARALARGKGFASLRQMHRDVRPMTPLLLFAIMKLRGGIGAMHAVMIALTLLSHALAFLTLRRWFNDRLALLATIATATSWWVYANAFTIMTEPLFLVMVWGAFLALSFVPANSRQRQWMLVFTAALLMAGAWENRVAAALLLPGMIFGLWMSNRDVGRRTRLGWVAVFAIVFAILIWDYRRPAPGMAMAEARQETYHLNFFVGMHHPLIELPASAGRWISESLAAPSGTVFDGVSRRALPLSIALQVAIFLLACVGWRERWRGKHWYAAGMAMYFVPIVIQWGARIKPRYMNPLVPVLFIQLCLGCMWVWGRISTKDRSGHHAPLRSVAPLVLAVLLLLNLGAYGVEFYIRHLTPLNFYDVARRGAFAELIDIGAYVESHAAIDAVIAVNWPPPSSRPPEANFAPDRRIVQFLCDREVAFANADSPPELPKDLSDRAGLYRFLNQVSGDWAIVYYDGNHWPSYHWPLVKSAPQQGVLRWWQLFHRNHATNQWDLINPPPQRDGVRDIPGLNRGWTS